MAAALPCLHGSCQLDGAGKQQQFLSQRCLTRIRVGNDAESPAAGNLTGNPFRQVVLGFRCGIVGGRRISHSLNIESILPVG